MQQLQYDPTVKLFRDEETDQRERPVKPRDYRICQRCGRHEHCQFYSCLNGQEWWFRRKENTDD